jgi:hypothetical protein
LAKGKEADHGWPPKARRPIMLRRNRNRHAPVGAPDSRRGRGRSVAITAALLACFGVLSASSASASTWHAGMKIINNSKYDLTLVQQYVDHVENFNPAIPTELPAGQSTPLMTWEDSEKNAGTRYSAYYGWGQGNVGYTVKIDCTDTSIFGCLDYHRSTYAEVLKGSPVSVSWTDNGGSPSDGYYGTLTINDLAPTSGWKNCGPGGLGSGFANVLVHGMGCGRAKAVIRRGHGGPNGWRARGWRCSSSRGDGRLHVKCVRHGKKFQFDRD